MQRKNFISALILGIALSLGAGGLAVAKNTKPLTTSDVVKLEKEWGVGIVDIGKTFQAGGDYETQAKKLIDLLYGYDEGKVLFKPTKAAQDQFREDKEQALSYFVGGSNPEDHGFAIQPWSKVRFENQSIVIDKDSAIAMGNYYFTDAKTNKEVKVEFTFAIKRANNNRPVIFLHHSSLPYQPQH
ncbi:MAG: hypothetical protein PHO64_02580 [Thiomonas sp.]|nr:hypothetical protein [Thiomonas sp.]